MFFAFSKYKLAIQDSRRPPRRAGEVHHDRWRWRPRLPILDLGGSRCFVRRHSREDMRPTRRTYHVQRRRPGPGGVYDGIGRVDVGEVRPLVRREEGGEIHRHGGGSIHQGMRSRGETRSAWWRNDTHGRRRRPGSKDTQ